MSDDDIDIEEHDVLDNPAIKNIFPDLSILKQEINNSFNQDDKMSIPEFTLRSNQDVKDKEPLNKFNDEKNYSVYQKDIKKEFGSVTEHPFHKNKLIIGSKPSKSPILDYEDFFEKEVKLKGAHVQLEDLSTYLEKSDRYCGRCLILFPNRIVYQDHNNCVHIHTRGSFSLCEKQNELDSHLLKVIAYEPTSLLSPTPNQNRLVIGTNKAMQLHASSKRTAKQQMSDSIPIQKNNTSSALRSRILLCKRCKRIFKHPSNLSRHLKTVNCTNGDGKLPNNNLKKMGLVENRYEKGKHIGTDKMCSHCNCKFPNQGALINHMYSVLHSKMSSNAGKVRSMSISTTKSGKSRACAVSSTSKISHNSIVKSKSQKSGCQSKLKSGNNKHETSPKIPRNLVTKSSVKPAGTLYYKCPVCRLYFITVEFCLAHLTKYHKMKINAEEIELVPFQRVCKLCMGNYKSRKNFNVHIYRYHRKMVHSTGSQVQKSKCLRVNVTRVTSQHKDISTNIGKRLTTEESPLPSKPMTQKENAMSVPIENSEDECSEELIDDMPLSTLRKHSINEDVAVKKVTEDYYTESIALDSNDLNPSFILKSILFKCNRCDIHFISAKIAMNHLDHMELLVNWKCSKCNRIFKKEDQESHEKQHTISNDYMVHDFHLYGTSVLSKVLLKCVKCAVHFNEEKFSNHFKKCGRIKQDSVYCNWCDILIDKTISKFHESCHEQDNMKLEDLTIVEAEILTNTDISNDQHPNKEKLAIIKKKDTEANNVRLPNKVITLGTKRKTDTHISNDRLLNKEKRATKRNKDNDTTKDQLTNNDTIDIKIMTDSDTNNDQLLGKKTPGKKRKIVSDSNCRLSNEETLVTKRNTKGFGSLLNMCYCNTCHCYIVECHKRDVHMESRCSHMVKYVCKFCGLVLTAKSYQTHKNLHLSMKNLKLHDFSFSDIRSGEKICPPIPHYPKCENCEVHFASKSGSRGHECIKNIYLTCQICDIKLSEEAFKLHMPFHKLHDIGLYVSVNFNEITNADTEFCTVDNEMLDFVTDTEIWNSATEDILTSNVNNINMSNNSTMLNNYDNNIITTTTISTGNERKETASSNSTNDKLLFSNTVNSKSSEDKDTEAFHSIRNTEYVHCPLKDLETNLEEDERSDQSIEHLLFVCKNCRVAVDAYDKVVEHCQWHYSREQIEILTSQCHLCDIIFEKSSYIDHEKYHLEQRHKNMLRFFYFDTCYFRSNNDIWIKHLFGSLPKEEIDKIICKTIYKFEYRMKMDIIQHGAPDLTVYKCDKCQCFVDGSSIYRHAENSCFKLRKHPCSICGLPFIASLTRLRHEKIHENREITQQSYQIVVFNRDEHKHLNNRLNSQSKYVLYQCRNCNGVISDKCRIIYHTCNSQDLVKCLKCGLLLDKSDYESHVVKHEELLDFEVNNMKVIMTGSKVNQNICEQSLGRTEFKGVMKDYTFYSCKRCQTCFQTLRMMSEHICCFGGNRSKCADCDLYFYSSKIKTHQKLHEIDMDFIQQNMLIIPTDPRSTNSNSKTEDSSLSKTLISKTAGLNKNESVKTDDKDVPSTSCLVKLTDRPKIIQNPTSVLSTEPPQKSENENDSEVNDKIQTDYLNTAVEKIASIHKCYCGLHFLDRLSILSHMKVCNLRMRASRQKCTKCGLTFTPNILYSHLLMHHGNKKNIYKFHVVEPMKIMNTSEENANTTVLKNKSDASDIDKTIYKCKECSIHYLTKKAVLLHISKNNEHFNRLQDICNICGLNFIAANLAQHILKHHKRLHVDPNEFIIKEY